MNYANCEKGLRVGGVSADALSEEDKNMTAYPKGKQRQSTNQDKSEQPFIPPNKGQPLPPR